uniref:Uncharacterized protein n=1 Tax=Candidatus Kentrum eta TaxID=2126337 RepID=A0A450V0I5_9GAMM|nr:MAG: hypothetical protein BECKH772A_GA0070896_101362 [Candidatus Kentron sp. H]VFJ98517.1 MAG: hypothetical protein BECKH772B_GA0070898_101367 [Candidatus Kentron sp. H]VFK03551.1 MAG: hypothetical protein BECKH772C_GA0070978_101346 [Candidatus Kentron sp. H]
MSATSSSHPLPVSRPMRRRLAKKLFGNSHRSEAAPRLWLPQGAMGAKIRIVVDYTTQFSPPSQRGRTQFGRRRSR